MSLIKVAIFNTTPVPGLALTPPYPQTSESLSPMDNLKDDTAMPQGPVNMADKLNGSRLKIDRMLGENSGYSNQNLSPTIMAAR